MIFSLTFLYDEALWTKLICFICLVRNRVLLQNIEKMEENLNQEKYGSTWTLFKLFLSAFFLCHIVGTMYYFLGILEMNYYKEDISWIEIYEI
jgi:hypothetical protein